VDTEYGRYLLDLALNPLRRDQVVFLLISEDGKIEAALEGVPWKGKYIIKRETEGLPPSRLLYSINDIVNAPTLPLEKAFDLAHEVLTQTVVFNDLRVYDIVTAWCMYTWLRGLFPKNVNLYFLGLPGTGKSQALKYCKHFARYVVDYDPTSEKSYKWNISFTLGVLAIDEAEYINRIKAAKLRKYHETDVTETRVIGLPLVGLTPIDLRVDAPIVMAATHPPPDTAFMQRGYIIRMTKGSPRIKDFDLIPDLDFRKIVFAKSVLCNWKRVWESLTKVYFKLSARNLDERVKDLALPICAILDTLSFDYEWVLEYAKYSFTQGNFASLESAVFIESLLHVVKDAKTIDGKYVIDMGDAVEKVSKTASKLGVSTSKLSYFIQYLFSGCEVSVLNGGLYYVCDKKTIDAFLRSTTLEKEDSYLLGVVPKNASRFLLSLAQSCYSYVKNQRLCETGKEKELVPYTIIRKYAVDRAYRKITDSRLLEIFRRNLVDRYPPSWILYLGIRPARLDNGVYGLELDLRRICRFLPLLEDPLAQYCVRVYIADSHRKRWKRNR